MSLFLLFCIDEEPFLIFANRYYLRKLSLDGTNYTLLKQVPFLMLFYNYMHLYLLIFLLHGFSCTMNGFHL